MKLAGALSISPLELLDGIHWTPGTSADGSFSITERIARATAARAASRC